MPKPRDAPQGSTSSDRGATMAVAALAAVLVLAALLVTSPGGPAAARGAPAVVWGRAHLGAPVVGATVAVIDRAGLRILAKANATSATGSFMLEMPAIPEGFALEVAGGTANGAPLQGVLLRRVWSFDNATTYKVNALSTIEARYAARNAGMARSEVEAAVKAYAGIPRDAALAQVIGEADTLTSSFDHAVLMQQAEDEGLGGDVLAALAAEVGTGKSRIFTVPGNAEAPLVSGAYGDLAGPQAVEPAAPVPAGGPVLLMGIGAALAAAPPEPSSEQLAELNDQLAHIDGILTGLRADLDAQGRAVNATRDAMRAHLRPLGWDAQAPLLDADAAATLALAGEMHDLASTAVTGPAELAGLRARYGAFVDRVLVGRDLPKAQRDLQYWSSLYIQIWARAAMQAPRPPEDVDLYASYLVHIQALAHLVILEARTGAGADTTGDIEAFGDSLLRVVTDYVRWKEKYVVQTKTGDWRAREQELHLPKAADGILARTDRLANALLGEDGAVTVRLAMPDADSLIETGGYSEGRTKRIFGLSMYQTPVVVEVRPAAGGAAIELKQSRKEDCWYEDSRCVGHWDDPKRWVTENAWFWLYYRFEAPPAGDYVVTERWGDEGVERTTGTLRVESRQEAPGGRTLPFGLFVGAPNRPFWRWMD